MSQRFNDRSYEIFAVDFDGVLCRGAWPEIGEPLKYNIELVIELRRRGNKIILWSCRTGHQLEQAVEWCRERGLEFDAVNENLLESVIAYGGDTRKIFADCYIDDKALVVDEDTDAAVRERQALFLKLNTPNWSKTVEERIADGEIDPEYFFEGGGHMT